MVNMNIEEYYKSMPIADYIGNKKPAWVGRYRTWIFYWNIKQGDYVAAPIMTYWDGSVFRYTNLEDISTYECAMIWQWSFWPVNDVVKDQTTLSNCEKAGIVSDLYYEPLFGPKIPYIHCEMISEEDWKNGYVKTVSKNRANAELHPAREYSDWRKSNEN